VKTLNTFKMKKYIIHILIVSLLAGVFISCQDEYVSNLVLDKDVTISEFSVDGNQGVIDEAKKTITVTVPDGTDVSNVSPVIKIADGAEITPAITANMDFTNPIEVQIVNGDVYSNYTISVTEQFFIGFLGTAANVAAITEDDQKAAAEWFFKNYENGVYISFDDIKNGKVDIKKFRLLWWYYDESRVLPNIALDTDVFGKIKSYFKDGGNLMFNSLACSYFWNLGRLTGTFNMAIGDGPGGDNGDTWAIGVNVGGKHDMSGHPIYKGISFTTDAGGFKSFPAIGPGWKEDHNYALLDVAAFYGFGNTDEAAYNAFTEGQNVKWLGTWDWMHDYWMAGTLELLPTAEFKGRALYHGIGGFEFNQNAEGEINPDGNNPYSSNIVLIIKNSVNYLSQKN
jgi:hypothetical protein